MTDNLSFEIQLNKLEEILSKTAEKRGFELSERKKEDHRDWYWQIPCEYKAEKVSLVIEAYETESYRICGSINTGSDSEFIDITSYTTENIVDLISRLDLYLDFVEQQQIPADYLPEQDVWKHTDLFPIPKQFRYEIPTYMVKDRYRLRRGKERLEVRRAWTPKGESMTVSYEGKELNEMIYIKNGEITNVNTDFVFKSKPIPEDATPDEIWRWLGDVFNCPKPEKKTYRNIKRFEEKLKELPWQEDLKAIYLGSGEFNKDN